MKSEYPILENDCDEEALIEPARVVCPVDAMPECCVMPIYKSVIDVLEPELEEITGIVCTMGRIPVFRMDYEGQDIAVIIKGKTWTTDAIYRETKSRIARRRSEGCQTVEMECSALLAVAQFRHVNFGQLLAAEDDVSGDVWDHRQREKPLSPPEKLFWLSAEACVQL